VLPFLAFHFRRRAHEDGEVAQMTTSDGQSSQNIVSRKRLTPSEREQLLLEGAIGYVSENGFGFSTRDLAQALGVSQSLIYRYFSTKQMLIEKIYDSIYIGRWNPEWDTILTDRSMPIEARLEKYLADYARVVIQKDWVRIFLSSSFDEAGVAQKYLTMLRRRIFDTWLSEHLAALRLSKIPESRDYDLAIELIWGFHSSIFYLGVRKWVYRIPIKAPVDAIISTRLEAFLPGFEAYLRRVGVRDCDATE
jgi:AcrR family transcriptional regulator